MRTIENSIGAAAETLLRAANRPTCVGEGRLGRDRTRREDGGRAKSRCPGEVLELHSVPCGRGSGRMASVAHEAWRTHLAVRL